MSLRVFCCTGCDAKVENKDSLTAKKLAQQELKRKAVKECSRAEKGKVLKDTNAWAVVLYDFCYFSTTSTFGVI